MLKNIGIRDKAVVSYLSTALGSPESDGTEIRTVGHESRKSKCTQTLKSVAVRWKREQLNGLG